MLSPTAQVGKSMLSPTAQVGQSMLVPPAPVGERMPIHFNFTESKAYLGEPTKRELTSFFAHTNLLIFIAFSAVITSQNLSFDIKSGRYKSHDTVPLNFPHILKIHAVLMQISAGKDVLRIAELLNLMKKLVWSISN